MPVQYDIIVYGRVQGVGFRAAARNQARSMNLKGWVENNKDGSVHIVVSGNQEQCGQLIQWCRNGSGYSWVERLEIKEMSQGQLSAFFIKY
ncbi:MAG: acylphosphatase [Bacteroidales bacterium]|nr:acylphosphatase [Bacteroidales bacterium]